MAKKKLDNTKLHGRRIRLKIIEDGSRAVGSHKVSFSEISRVLGKIWIWEINRFVDENILHNLMSAILDKYNQSWSYTSFLQRLKILFSIIDRLIQYASRKVARGHGPDLVRLLGVGWHFLNFLEF